MLQYGSNHFTALIIFSRVNVLSSNLKQAGCLNLHKHKMKSLAKHFNRIEFVNVTS